MTRPSRILVVDDEPSIRQLYGKILFPGPKRDVLAEGARLFGGPDPEASSEDRDQYDLSLANGGPDAVRVVQEAVNENCPFAVAFIDFSMPGMNGIETARQIRNEDPNVKIVMVSGFNQANLEESTDEIGAQDIVWLQKPFSAKDVNRLARTLTVQWVSEAGSTE